MRSLRNILTPEQIERRKPVWLALSEMYLDTELADEDHQRIAAVCRAQQLLPDEVRQINYDEVSDVCIANLYSVAGEWAGFDPDWLFEHILSQASSSAGWLRRKHVDSFTKRHMEAIVRFMTSET